MYVVRSLICMHQWNLIPSLQRPPHTNQSLCTYNLTITGHDNLNSPVKLTKKKATRSISCKVATLRSHHYPPREQNTHRNSFPLPPREASSSSITAPNATQNTIKGRKHHQMNTKISTDSSIPASYRRLC